MIPRQKFSLLVFGLKTLTSKAIQSLLWKTQIHALAESICADFLFGRWFFFLGCPSPNKKWGRVSSPHTIQCRGCGLNRPVCSLVVQLLWCAPIIQSLWMCSPEDQSSSLPLTTQSVWEKHGHVITTLDPVWKFNHEVSQQTKNN